VKTKRGIAIFLAITALLAAMAMACSSPQAAPTAASKPAQQPAVAEVKPTQQPPAAAAKRVKLSLTLSEKSNWYKAGERFAQTVSDKTSGAYKVDMYPNNQLAGGSLVKAIEMLKSGAIDIHWTGGINLTSFDQKYTVFNMPWLIPSEEVADKVLEGPILEEARKMAQANDLLLLALGENGFRQLSNSKREVTSPDDLKGMRIRVPPIKMYTALFREFGADPVTIDFAEVYTALQRGTADGQENPFGTVVSAKIQEVQKYMSVWNYSYDVVVFLVSPTFWKSLTADQQKVFQDAATDSMKYQKQVHRAEEKELAGVIEKQGVKITYLTPQQIAAFSAKTKPIYDEFEPIIGKELLQKFRDVGATR